MDKQEIFEKLTLLSVEAGAFKSNIISAKNIEMNRSFRDVCATNACGMYGKCYMCPPDIGDIEALMSEIKKYDYALVYQTVTELEDSFDFEGMMEAKKKFYSLAQKIRKVFFDMNILNTLHLGAGGCGVCQKCAKVDNEPCRFPEKALSSLEAYGVNVSATVKNTKMKYINGADTVTYFGMVLFKENDLCLN